MENEFASNIFINKLSLKDRVLYVKIIWKPSENDLFFINIHDTDSTWSGVFSYESVKSKCDIETEEVYCNTVEKALRNNNDAFIYVFPKVDRNIKTNEFIWKQRFRTGFFEHGSVKVERDNELQSKDNLIDLLLCENERLKNIIEQDKKKIEELTDNLNLYKQELDKFSEIKTSLESTLYGKFVLVLNEKKKRIQLLEEHLQKFCNTQELNEF